MMDIKKIFLKRYKDYIATEYAEDKEIQLANFDGWDMIEFGQLVADEMKKTEKARNPFWRWNKMLGR